LTLNCSALLIVGRFWISSDDPGAAVFPFSAHSSVDSQSFFADLHVFESWIQLCRDPQHGNRLEVRVELLIGVVLMRC